MLALMRERSIGASPLTMLLGVDLVRCWDGYAELVIKIRPDLTQHRGTVHGGVLGAAVDNVGCWAAASLLGPLVTSSYTIHYLAPARGELVRATGRLAYLGGRNAVVHTEVAAETGRERTVVAGGLVAVRAVADQARPI
jgi:uncharacterized protein (TIGR00369 family)